MRARKTTNPSPTRRTTDLDEFVAALIALLLSGGDDTALALLLKNYGVNLLPQAIEQLTDEQVTQLQASPVGAYAVALAGLLTRAPELTPDEFEAELANLVREFGVTRFVTAADMPPDQPFTDAELDIINGYIDTNLESVPGLTADVYDEDTSFAALAARLFLWVNNLALLGMTAMVYGHPEQMYRFDLGPTLEHCDDCARLNGQVHSGDDWYASGLLPQSHNLQCGGWNCLCSLTPTDESERGDF